MNSDKTIEKYKLQFKIDGSVPISTIFQFTSNGIQNPCIELNDCEKVHSEISSDNPIYRDSETWMKWNSRLQFIGFDPVMVGGRIKRTRYRNQCKKRFSRRTRKHSVARE